MDGSGSKLVAKLRAVARGDSAPLGFGRRSESVLPALLLLVALPRGDEPIVAAVWRGRADAVLLRSPDYLVAAIAARPNASGTWGLDFASEQSDWLAAESLPSQHDADFVLVDAASAPPSVLESDFPGLLLAVPQDLPRGLLTTLNGLPVQAVVVDALAGGRPGGMSALDVARYRQLVDAFRMPVVVRSRGRLVATDVRALRRAGVAGLLLDLETGVTSQQAHRIVSAFSAAIAEAGRPLGRGESMAVSLPHLAARMEDEGDPLEPGEEKAG